MPEAHPDRSVGPVPTAARLVLLGLAAGLLTTGLYVVMVRTPTGQRLDDLAFEGRKAIVLGVRRAVALLLTATVPAVLIAWVAILVAVVRRQRIADGLITMVGVVATVVLARVLKSELPRPELFVPAFAGDANSFPSGHTAAVAATVMGGLSVCRADRRSTLAVLAAVFVGCYSAAMLCTGWHRPIDVLAGVALATAVMAPAVAVRVLLSPDPPAPSGPDPWGAAPPARIAVGAAWRCSVVALLAVGVAATGSALRSPVSNPVHSLAAHLVATSLSSACAAVLVLVFAAALGPRADTGLTGAGTGAR